VEYAYDSFYHISGHCVNSSDASIESNSSDLADANTCLDNRGIFLRDALFNGRQKELKIYVNTGDLQPIFNGTDTLYPNVLLQHVPESYFRYRKSLSVAQDANGNPFAEPANVYTNVTNGYGIFTIYTQDRVEVR